MHDLEYALVILSELSPKLDPQELSSILKELAGLSHEYTPSYETSSELVQRIQTIAKRIDPNMKI